MKRRVHEERGPAATPAQQENSTEQPPAQDVPSQGVRVAGEVRHRELDEVERIAGVLEVTSWVKRMFPRG